MHTTHTSRADLNLLPVLVALLDERHVSRAADRAGLSQPAMSRALQRLRRQFNDELLVRGPQGYSLTPRAERLLVDLTDAVATLERLLADERFDPSLAANTYRIAMTDYTFAMFGPALAKVILVKSPHSRLVCEPLDEDSFEQLGSGAVDVVLFGRSAPDGFSSQLLFEDELVCVVAADHPVAEHRTLTLEQYLQWPHVGIDIGSSSIERAVHSHGGRRQVSVTMPHHTLASRALPGTKLIVTMAGRLAAEFTDRSTTTILGAPRELGKLNFTTVWHPRLDNDPPQLWLRQLIRGIAETTHGRATN